MLGPLLIGLYVFVLSMFVGFEVIGKVAPTLHTALVSGMSAVAGITLIGGLYLAKSAASGNASLLACAAIGFASVNVVGAFVLTHRNLGATKKRDRA